MISRHRYISTLLIAFFISTALTGCSFYADFFVLNTTNREVMAFVKLQIPVSRAVSENNFIKLKYADAIMEVDDETEEKLTKKLDYKQIDSTTIAITIPAKSTVLMGGAHNRFFVGDSITLVKQNVATRYSMEDIYKKTKVKGGVFPPFHATYKIE